MERTPWKKAAAPTRLCLVFAACIGLMAFQACDGGGKGQEEDAGPIGKAFWGYWLEPSVMDFNWYMSDTSISSPYGSLEVQEAGDDYLVAIDGNNQQYRLQVAGSNLLRVSGGAKGFIYRRNGAEASISAKLVATSKRPARALSAAGNVGLILTNALNSSNVIEVDSDADGGVEVEDEVIAGDDYEVSLASDGSLVSSLHVAAPGEDVGVISIAPPKLGYTFKLSSGLGPTDIYYPGDNVELWLFIKNEGSKDISGLSYTLSSDSLSLLGAGGYQLSGSGLTISAGSQIVTKVSASLPAGTDFGGRDYLEPAISATIVAGGETWVDDSPLRIYRERRHVRIDCQNEGSCPVYGYFMSPDGIAIGFGASSTSDYVDLSLPYRSKAYRAYLFPNPDSDDLDGGRGILYGLLASSSAEGFGEEDPVVPIAATGNQNGLQYSYGTGGNHYGSVENWCRFCNLTANTGKQTDFNDGAEPNDSLGQGPIVYAGGGFHGYLNNDDVDAFLLDFSQADPAGKDSTRDNDFELAYCGILEDQVQPYNFSESLEGNGDDILDAGEAAVALFDLRCHIDPSQIPAGYHAYLSADADGIGLFPTQVDGATVSASLAELFLYNDSGDTEVAEADSVYAANRSVGVYIKLPGDYSGDSISLYLTVATGRTAEDSVYGTYSCQLPVGRAP